MGLFFGIFLGVLFGVALMAGWERMMTYRSRKRIAKVCYIHQCFVFSSNSQCGNKIDELFKM